MFFVKHVGNWNGNHQPKFREKLFLLLYKASQVWYFNAFIYEKTNVALHMVTASYLSLKKRHLALLCRKRHHRFGRNRFWEDRSICFTSSSVIIGKSPEIVCTGPYPNKVWFYLFCRRKEFNYFWMEFSINYVSKENYYMACVCSRYNARSDWLIVTEL